MTKDQYDNVITTTSATARDQYIDGVDRVLAGNGSITQCFRSAIDADPGFALAHVGLARGAQFEGDMKQAKAAIAAARALASNGDTREQSHINAMGLMIEGKGPEAYRAIRAHVDTYPRDALIAQTCSSVFGLIGFSGQPGREAEILAYTSALLPHYGEDWWCLSQYAFALCENGALAKADDYIDRSLALRPRNANGAHVRSHIYYETGEAALGASYLTGWIEGYERSGYMHGHLAWHAALWALDAGDIDAMWQRVEADLDPDVSQSLPINVLTDMASLLCRAEVCGVTVPPARWTQISAYARQFFPHASLGFIDFHAALAHAMAGDTDALSKIIDAPNPLTGDLVKPVAEAYREIAAKNWVAATAYLTSAMHDHARLGGSRAQRDVLELSLMSALLRQGKDDEAQRLLCLRRPVLAQTRALHGLRAH